MLGTIPIPILQMSKLRHKQVMRLSPGNTSAKIWIQAACHHQGLCTSLSLCSEQWLNLYPELSCHCIYPVLSTALRPPSDDNQPCIVSRCMKWSNGRKSICRVSECWYLPPPKQHPTGRRVTGNQVPCNRLVAMHEGRVTDSPLTERKTETWRGKSLAQVYTERSPRNQDPNLGRPTAPWVPPAPASTNPKLHVRPGDEWRGEELCVPCVASEGCWGFGT